MAVGDRFSVRTRGKVGKLLGQFYKTAAFIREHPVGRRHPLRCFSRLVLWQARSRIVRGPHKVAFVGETRLFARSGETGVSGNIYVGLHEFNDMAFVAHVLRPGDRFVDVGANAGSYTVLAAGWCGADVISIEPAPETFSRLEANIALNSLAELVEAHCCAIGAAEGTVTFTAGADTTNHVVDTNVSGDIATIEVPLRSLDALLASRGATVMKLDVEGYETEALQGAEETLARPELQAVLVEIFTDRSGTENRPSSFALLGRSGFEPFRYDPWTRQIVPEEHPRSGNVLFLRNPAWVAKRLTTARGIPVMGETI